MTHLLSGLMLGLLVLISPLSAQDRAKSGVPTGKIKKVDTARNVVTVTIKDKDVELWVDDDTKMVDTQNRPIEDGLKDKRFKEGVEVMFFTTKRDGKEYLRGIKIMEPSGKDRLKPVGQRGKLKKLDVENKRLTLTVDGKDRDFVLTDDTRVGGASGKTLKERFKGLKEGVEVEFIARRNKDGKEVIVGIRQAGGQRPGPVGERIKFDTSKLKPLPELGTGKYQEHEGGLYPGGKNDRPAAHEKAGLRLAAQVVPRDGDGKPSPDGKIVLLSVGMSNTSQVSGGFKQHLREAEGINPRLVFIDGAQGGMTAQAIQDPDDDNRGTHYWTVVDRRLKEAGLTRAQVQAVWIKQADAGPDQGFPGYARKLQGELKRIVQVLAKRFPNVKLVYLSSRTFGGYARTRLNPEPYAYESGFAVKWLIGEQLDGDKDLNYDAGKGAVKAPWLSWGPYLWANGTTKRADGFSYSEDDFSPQDGTHLSRSGVSKTGKLLLDFFRSDSTTKPWFVASKSQKE
jgi:Cu/Ag efflux protein CusF